MANECQSQVLTVQVMRLAAPIADICYKRVYFIEQEKRLDIPLSPLVSYRLKLPGMVWGILFMALDLITLILFLYFGWKRENSTA